MAESAPDDVTALVQRAKQLHDERMCQDDDSDFGNCDERNMPRERWCAICTAEALAQRIETLTAERDEAQRERDALKAEMRVNPESAA